MALIWLFEVIIFLYPNVHGLMMLCRKKVGFWSRGCLDKKFNFCY